MAAPCRQSYHHIYKCLTPQSSFTSIDKCDCPPEYYCATICGEETYEEGTYISWQHFPKSTSTRSICLDDSSQEILRKSISDESEEKIKTEKELSVKSEHPEKPITKSIAQLNALHYLEIRHINQLLNFLIGHLVCNEPDDPINFLVTLLDKCINFRDSYGEPPLLFTHSHITSLYTAFDPFARGSVTVDQYKEAFENLGISNHKSQNDEEPPVNDKGQIEVKHFEFEAEKRMVESLRQMLTIPQSWQENRKKWKKKMDKISSTNQENYVTQENSFMSAKDQNCNCSHLDIIRSTGCQCVRRKVSPSVETEQMFFDYYKNNTKLNPC